MECAKTSECFQPTFLCVTMQTFFGREKDAWWRQKMAEEKKSDSQEAKQFIFLEKYSETTTL